jgi:hypothetical protein
MADCKIHIARFSDTESFKTYCGINEWNCSEDFWEADNLVSTAEVEKCTCSTCKVLFDKHEAQFFDKIKDI